MSVANRITLGRLGFAVVLFGVLSVVDLDGPHGGAWLITAMLLFIVVVATDALDGYYARKLGEESDFGRVADPAVDKVVVCGTLVFLTADEASREIVAPWMVVLIVGREFVISSLRGFLESRGIEFGADLWGKLKMIIQSIAIPTVFFFRIIARFFPGVDWAIAGARYLAVTFVWLALAFTVYSAIDYVKKASRLLGSPA